MPKKLEKRHWAEDNSVTNAVRGFQSRLNQGSSLGGKLYVHLPPSNRKERRLLGKEQKRKKVMVDKKEINDVSKNME